MVLEESEETEGSSSFGAQTSRGNKGKQHLEGGGGGRWWIAIEKGKEEETVEVI